MLSIGKADISTTALRIHISQHDGANDKCSDSSRRARPSDSCSPTRLFTVTSGYSDTLCRLTTIEWHALRHSGAGMKKRARGRLPELLVAIARKFIAVLQLM
jgi:hypothetical protein